MTVKKGKIGGRFTSRIAAAAFLLIVFQALTGGCSARAESTAERQGTLGSAMLQELAMTVERALYAAYVPSYAFSQESAHETYWLLQEQIDSVLPFYGYLMEGVEEGRAGSTLREILLAEAREEGGEESESREEDGEGNRWDADTHESDSALEDLLRAENEAAQRQMRVEGSRSYGQGFVPHTRQGSVDLNSLRSYETLLREFYTVDSNTMAGSDQLDVDRMMAENLTISKDSEGPQILIYHTHSQEGFADSVPGDDSTTIQGVGERLAQILRDTYGYRVLHHTGEYDVGGRDDAYAKALPEVEQVLAENPSIQVVIDLHRDEMPAGTRLVADLDGRPTARFMFFNGLSRTKKTGNIAYLYNENLDSNLAFSFQMQLKAAEYYPGLTRKIYLKGYRYNMHLKPRYLLIELGAQNNTLEEAMNACDPLAHVLDLVLSGQ